MPSQVCTAPLLRLSYSFTCVYAAGTNFGTNQTSTDIYEFGQSIIISLIQIAVLFTDAKVNILSILADKIKRFINFILSNQ